MQDFFGLIKDSVRPSRWKDPVDILLRNEERKL